MTDRRFVSTSVIGMLPARHVQDPISSIQHDVASDCKDEGASIAFLRCVKQALQTGASRVWSWCRGLLMPSSRDHQLRDKDCRMLSLMERERDLENTLAKTEKALRFAPVKTGHDGCTGKMNYLTTVRTCIAAELREVENRRVATLMQHSLV